MLARINITSLGITAAAFMLIIGLLGMCAFTVSLHGDLALPNSDIRVMKSAPFSQVRRPSVDEEVVLLPAQFKNRDVQTRQFSYVVPTKRDLSLPTAIYIPSLGGKASVSINGVPLSRSVPAPLLGFGFGPERLYSDIDQKFFHPGLNRVDVLLYDDQSHAGVRRIYFGDTEILSKAALRHEAWSLLSRTTLFGGGIVGLLCSLMGLFIGQNRILALAGLGLSSVIMATLSSSLAQNNLAVITEYPALISGGAFIASAVSAFVIGRDVNPSRPVLFAMAIVCTLAVGTWFIMVSTPIWVPYPISMIRLSVLGVMPYLVIGMPVIMVHEIGAFRKHLRDQQAELLKKDTIIAQQEDALRNEIKQKAVIEERQRFTRDMHDGIGGQLLSMLVRVRSGRMDLKDVESEVQDGLNDLRLVVDSLDNVGEDLEAALTTFRARAQKQFDAEGIELTWTQSENLNDAQVGTRQTLNLYRFMQEAVSNILRHANAGAASIDIKTSVSSKNLMIKICDDGVGIEEGKVAIAGKGLKNMTARAAKLGGEVNIGNRTDAAGTYIELTMPLKSEAEAGL